MHQNSFGILFSLYTSSTTKRVPSPASPTLLFSKDAWRARCQGRCLCDSLLGSLEESRSVCSYNQSPGSSSQPASQRVGDGNIESKRRKLGKDRQKRKRGPWRLAAGDCWNYQRGSTLTGFLPRQARCTHLGRHCQDRSSQGAFPIRPCECSHGFIVSLMALTNDSTNQQDWFYTRAGAF